MSTLRKRKIEEIKSDIEREQKRLRTLEDELRTHPDEVKGRHDRNHAKIKEALKSKEVRDVVDQFIDALVIKNPNDVAFISEQRAFAHKNIIRIYVDLDPWGEGDDARAELDIAFATAATVDGDQFADTVSAEYAKCDVPALCTTAEMEEWFARRTLQYHVVSHHHAVTNRPGLISVKDMRDGLRCKTSLQEQWTQLCAMSPKLNNKVLLGWLWLTTCYKLGKHKWFTGETSSLRLEK